MNLTELMSAGTFDGEVYRLDAPEDWMQGRTMYGGLSAALCHEAAQRAFADLAPLRSAMVSFIGPAGGAVEARASMLRAGKSVSYVNADLRGEKGLATRCEFAFGAARESRFDDTFAAPVEASRPDDCEVYFPEALGPAFAAQFETRLAFGARPVTASTQTDHGVWVRHRDPSARGASALIALADMPPPAILPMLEAFAPVSSMTWMINFLEDDPQPRNGWWLVRSRAEHAREGYSSQDMAVYGEGGRMVCAMRQCVAVFA